MHVVFGRVISGMDVVEEMVKFGSKSGKVKGNIMIKDCGVINPANTAKE